MATGDRFHFLNKNYKIYKNMLKSFKKKRQLLYGSV